MGVVYLDVDITQLQTTIDLLRAAHTKGEFELLMKRAFWRTGSKVRTIMKTDIPKQYYAKPTWIGKNVGKPQMGFGGFAGTTVSCSIPIDGVRGVMGSQFKASGPRGRRSKTMKAYKITAKVVRNQTTTLPAQMPVKPYGGNPPFIIPSGATIKKGLVFTRKTKNRLPIVRVVGIGVPQMPMNQAQDQVQDDIMVTLKNRIEHEHQYLIGKCR